MSVWLQVFDFYRYDCENNSEFLHKFNDIPFQQINNYLNPYGNILKNFDIVESIDQHNELTQLYKKNSLIAFRPGCVEISFLLSYKFNIMLPTHLSLNEEINKDIYMRANAGLYYKDISRRTEVLEWWCDNFIDLIRKCTYCSCYCILHFDLVLLSILNIKGKLYNYDCLYKVILENSERKKILYIGNAVESIKAGYNRGLQNVWKFEVSDFTMYYVKTPQTTTGMEYPNDTMIETCYDIINQIDRDYSDFDTAIFGCGAYGSSLINILYKKYPEQNLIYLGSDCFKMFGIKINLQPWELYDVNVKKDMVIDIVETLPDGCKNYPEKKYWKI